ncbi:hypothetical protein [Halospeciosus flavus]|uniref:Uncharacterized protein n=1 Tax=Halospeciosus flavus TaxID=3032283 RepID=A0ABD5Z0X2_9EURY|nr:hypothetical protein [Halospeciosus flavus]
MYEPPSPTHGFFLVTVAFWVYIALAGAIALGARWLGVSVGGTLFVFVLGALVLLKPFLPLFRRLLPTRPGEE